eukprot:4961606-Pleurochrysis_carterae.AAC.2
MQTEIAGLRLSSRACKYQRDLQTEIYNAKYSFCVIALVSSLMHNQLQQRFSHGKHILFLSASNDGTWSNVCTATHRRRGVSNQSALSDIEAFMEI